MTDGLCVHPPDDKGNEKTRSLGMVVLRGTLIVTIAPADGSEAVANPFLKADEEEDDD